MVKVEPPEGNSTRGWGPPWVGDEAAGTRTAAYYLAVNRNKRSLRLDLKQPAGADVLRRLLATADVFVENLRPESLARLGFGDDVLSRAQLAAHPSFDQRLRSGSPLVGRPGYNFLPPGRGRPDVDHGRDRMPTAAARRRSASRSPTSRPGSTRRSGILAGARRPGARRVAGAASASGSTCRSSASTLAILVNQAQNAFVDRRRAGPARQRPPEHRPVRDVRHGRRRDRDRGRQRAAVAAAAAARSGCRRWPTIRGSPRTATRVANRGELIADASRAAQRSGPPAEWLAALEAADIPAGPINDIPAAFASEQAVARADDGRRSTTRRLGGRTPGRAADRAVGDPGRDPDGRRRCSASMPTRSSPSSAIRPQTSSVSEPPRRSEAAQSSWRRNESHDRPAITGDQGDVRERPGPTTSPGGISERERPRRRSEADRQVRRDRREHAEQPDHDERRDADARQRPAPTG